MKFLIIGLGSMGKRRIRNLKVLNYLDITGFDIRDDRRKEAEETYGIKTISDLNDISTFDAIIIATPPDKHSEYIRLSVKHQKPCFVELSLLLQDLSEINELVKKNKANVSPSCTFRFHPAIKIIKQIVKGGEYGRVTNFVYHSGQYLPDWHPWENIKDFFVSKNETSGCKEIISFELHWINDVFGRPNDVFTCSERTFKFDIETDDTYILNLKYNNSVGVLLIDVVSRFATRILVLNLEKAQIRWNYEDKEVKLYDAENKKWLSFFASPDSIEDMYVEELNSFIDEAKGLNYFNNTLDEDIEILKIVESIDHNRFFQKIERRVL